MSHERPNINRVRQMLREHDEHQTDEHDIIGSAAPPATEPPAAAAADPATGEPPAERSERDDEPPQAPVP